METFNKQYPIALQAIAAHTQAHDLPAPVDIYAVDEVRDGRLDKIIRLHLPYQASHAAWVSSVHVDAEETEPADGGRGTRHEWMVRLPDTGIRLRLVGYQHAALAVIA